MSGGSMDYICHRVENDTPFHENTPERKAFRAHLALVAKALHDIEWVDSADYAPGDENEAIRACLAPGATLTQALKDGYEALDAICEQVSKIDDGFVLALAAAGKAKGGKRGRKKG